MKAPINVFKRRALSEKEIEDFHIALKGKPQIIEVDTVVICAGQESKRELK